MKPLEIPYNFDTQLIDFLKIYSIDIHCIYVPPFKEHYKCAKYYYTHDNGIYMGDTFPNTLLYYEQHIQYINDNFPDKLMLLLQQPIEIMNIDLISYYISLGFKKFCVGSIQQAKIIKEYFKNINIEIIGSITMKINKLKLKENQDYNKYFDGFVLWFPFNRNLKKIQELPNNFKYILLINCKCCSFCDGTHHWFADYNTEKHLYCPKSSFGNSPENKNFKDLIFIRPNDLYLFDNYIDYYKLQGREYTTKQIINDIVYYTSNYKYYLLNEQYNVNQIYNIQ